MSLKRRNPVNQLSVTHPACILLVLFLWSNWIAPIQAFSCCLLYTLGLNREGMGGDNLQTNQTGGRNDSRPSKAMQMLAVSGCNR